MTAVAWCGRNRTGLVYLVIFGGLILIIVLASIKGNTEDQEAAPWYASESYKFVHLSVIQLFLTRAHTLSTRAGSACTVKRIR